MKILYTGAEGFSIPPSPQTARQRKAGAGRFMVQSEVAADLRTNFELDELSFINRYRDGDITRTEFANNGLDALEFRPNETTEIANDEIADAFLKCRYFHIAPPELSKASKQVKPVEAKEAPVEPKEAPVEASKTTNTLSPLDIKPTPGIEPKPTPAKSKKKSVTSPWESQG